MATKVLQITQPCDFVYILLCSCSYTFILSLIILTFLVVIWFRCKLYIVKKSVIYSLFSNCIQLRSQLYMVWKSKFIHPQARHITVFRQKEMSKGLKSFIIIGLLIIFVPFLYNKRYDISRGIDGRIWWNNLV